MEANKISMGNSIKHQPLIFRQLEMFINYASQPAVYNAVNAQLKQKQTRINEKGWVISNQEINDINALQDFIEIYDSVYKSP